MLEKIQRKLQEAADVEYKKFHQSLVPGLTSMLGVRMPRLREIAKEAAKDDWKDSWEQLDDGCYEELMIKGMLIGYGHLDREEQEQYLRAFVPKINNWAICDSCCTTWKFMKQDQEFWYDVLEEYLNSEREYEVRFALVSLLDYFVKEKFLERIFYVLDCVHHEAYYVKMAAAWLLSVCYVKFPSETWKYLE